MREFIYFSRKARTSANVNESRIDLILRVILNSFFVSYAVRKDVRLHLVFYGPEDPPKHIQIDSNAKIPLMEKDFSIFLKEILFNYENKKNAEVLQNVHIEKKSLGKLIEELKAKDKTLYILSRKGKDIDAINISENAVFLLGEIPFKELRRLKRDSEIVSLGKTEYFTSQAVSILNYILDKRLIMPGELSLDRAPHS